MKLHTRAATIATLLTTLTAFYSFAGTAGASYPAPSTGWETGSPTSGVIMGLCSAVLDSEIGGQAHGYAIVESCHGNVPTSTLTNAITWYPGDSDDGFSLGGYANAPTPGTCALGSTLLTGFLENTPGGGYGYCVPSDETDPTGCLNSDASSDSNITTDFPYGLDTCSTVSNFTTGTATTYSGTSYTPVSFHVATEFGAAIDATELCSSPTATWGCYPSTSSSNDWSDVWSLDTPGTSTPWYDGTTCDDDDSTPNLLTDAPGILYAGILGDNGNDYDWFDISALTCAPTNITGPEFRNFPSYPTQTATGAPTDTEGPCSLLSAISPTDSATTSTGGNYSFTLTDAGSIDAIIVDPVDGSTPTQTLDGLTYLSADAQEFDDPGSIPTLTVHITNGTTINPNFYCVYAGEIYPWGSLNSSTAGPVSETIATADGGNFDFSSCTAAGGGLGLDPASWVPGIITEGKCSIEWLFIPNTTTFDNLENQFGIETNDPGVGPVLPSGHISDWLGSLSYMFAHGPTDSIEGIQTDITDGQTTTLVNTGDPIFPTSITSAPGGSHLNDYNINLGSFITGMQNAISPETLDIFDTIAVTGLVLSAWFLCWHLLRDAIGGNDE